MGLVGLGFSIGATALEYRSVLPPKAVLYDAPSAESSKVFILSQGYPVEVIVNLGNWLKVRDQQGSLSWIENKDLSPKRTLIATKKTEMRAAENVSSAMVATVEKEVVLELLDTTAKNGWLKVKHRTGLVGFVQASDVWGF
jgi:SH3-like domain-containing protein